MSARRAAVLAFSTTQLIGVVCSWLWQHVPGDIGMPMWGGALILLVPGNFLSPWLVEKLFWRSGLSLTSMGIISTLFLLIINAAVWYSVARAIGAIIARRGTHRSSLP